MNHLIGGPHAGVAPKTRTGVAPKTRKGSATETGKTSRPPQAAKLQATPPSPVKKRLRLHIGEVMASAEPVILQTLLGSCVAVCLHDPVTRIGGMNHILLPGSCEECSSTRFGVQAMELLINQLMNLGADRIRLVAKAFGGANVLPCLQAPTVGDANASFVRQFLQTECIPLIAQRLGGTHAVQLHFSTDTGKVSVHTVDGSRLPAIARDEQSYASAHSADTPVTGTVTLF